MFQVQKQYNPNPWLAVNQYRSSIEARPTNYQEFFELADNPTVTKVNPMGSKGAGEVGTACAMPAVVNAVVDALSPLGIKHLDMPVTSQKTWAVIKNADH